MADATRTSVLAGLSFPNRSGQIVIAEAVPAMRYSYRGAPEVLGDGFGIALPVEPMRANEAPGVAVLWLGPDEWLLIAPEDVDLRRRLQEAVAGKPAALVEISQRNVALTLFGPRAADVISSGCPLDLDLSTFPVGMCTRTILGKTEIVLWRRGAEEFHLECWRSFAPYVLMLLADAVGTLTP